MGNPIPNQLSVTQSLFPPFSRRHMALPYVEASLGHVSLRKLRGQQHPEYLVLRRGGQLLGDTFSTRSGGCARLLRWRSWYRGSLRELDFSALVYPTRLIPGDIYPTLTIYDPPILTILSHLSIASPHDAIQFQRFLYHNSHLCALLSVIPHLITT